MRAVVAAVHLPNVTDAEFESSLTELRELAKTLGYQVVGTFVQRRERFDAAAYVGIGKRKEIRLFVEGEDVCDEDDDAAREEDAQDHSPSDREQDKNLWKLGRVRCETDVTTR